ncbi:MAG: hypothetical protein Q3972_08970 [Corynebacterium sp.]|nr:hypothetical protein [Corynebacterium sp.]
MPVADAAVTVNVEGATCYTTMDKATFKAVDDAAVGYANKLQDQLYKVVIPSLVANEVMSQEEADKIRAANYTVQTPFNAQSMTAGREEWQRAGRYWLKGSKDRAKQTFDPDEFFIRGFGDTYADLAQISAVTYIIKTFYIQRGQGIGDPHKVYASLNQEYIDSLRNYLDFQWHVSRYSVVACLEALGGSVALVDPDPMPNALNPVAIAPTDKGPDGGKPSIWSHSSFVTVRFIGSS